MSHFDRGLVWFRRDLRATDNAALHHALKACRRVWCVFVFDTDILEPLLARGLTADRRVAFIRESLVQLDARLREQPGVTAPAKIAGTVAGLAGAVAVTGGAS